MRRVLIHSLVVSKFFAISCFGLFVVSLGLVILGRQINTDAVVAQVNDRVIMQSDYASYLEEHSVLSANSEDQDAMFDEFLNEIVLEEYLVTHGITVGEDELASRYEAAIASVGDESEYLAKVKKLRGLDKEDLLKEIRKDILLEKAAESLSSGREDVGDKIRKKVHVEVVGGNYE